jgi:FG-GAP repeat
MQVCRRILCCVIASALTACGIGSGHYFADGADGAAPDDVGDAAIDHPSGKVAFAYYVKASNTGAGDAFGTSVALSLDGSTLAVGAPRENSGNSNKNDDNANDAGAVYVLTYDGATWVEAYLKAEQPGVDDLFGTSVALSADGMTLAVGAASEDGNARMINGDQTNNTAPAAGAAYVFRRSGTTWRQEAYIKPSNLDDYDAFGSSVALSADGSLLAVGATGESGNGSAPDNNALMSAGAAYVFAFDGSNWLQQSYIKPSVPVGMIQFGAAVALSGDGSHLAVGVARDATYGEVYVFARNGSTWRQQLRYQSTDANTGFGSSVALARDGSLLTIGAALDSVNAPGGAVFTFTRNDTTWSPRSTALKPIRAGGGDDFGHSMSLSADGNLLAVGASLENGNGKGVDGDPANAGTIDSGAVYLFMRNGTDWMQQTYVKACNTAPGARLGGSVALSPDGMALATGAAAEASRATGVTMGPGGTDTGALDAGAVYVYRGSTGRALLP